MIVIFKYALLLDSLSKSKKRKMEISEILQNYGWYKTLSSEHKKQAEQDFLAILVESIGRAGPLFYKAGKLNVLPEDLTPAQGLSQLIVEAEKLPGLAQEKTPLAELKKYAHKNWSSLGQA